MTPTLKSRDIEALDQDSMERDISQVEKHVYRDIEKQNYGKDTTKQVYFRLCGQCKRPTAGHPLTENGEYPGYGKNNCNLEPLQEKSDEQQQLLDALDQHEEFDQEIRKKIDQLPFCRSRTNSEESGGLLEYHSDERHEIAFSCDQCPIKKKSKEELEQHMLVHQEHFKCEFCETQFMTKSDMKDHIKKSHYTNGDTEKINRSKVVFPCRTCSKQFENEQLLVTHVQKDHHTRRNKETLPCNICMSTFTSKDELKSHVCSKRDQRRIAQGQSTPYYETQEAYPQYYQPSNFQYQDSEQYNQQNYPYQSRQQNFPYQTEVQPESNMMMAFMKQMEQQRKDQERIRHEERQEAERIRKEERREHQEREEREKRRLENEAERIRQEERRAREEERKLLKEILNIKDKTTNSTIGNSKPDDCPKWSKDEEFETFKAQTLLWDSYTKTDPGRKLNMLLNSIKEGHIQEHSRLQFETIRQPSFMDKITEGSDSFDQNEAKRVVATCLTKLESWYGKSKADSCIESWRKFRDIKMEQSENVVDYIRRFEENIAKMTSLNLNIPDKIVGIQLVDRSNLVTYERRIVMEKCDLETEEVVYEKIKNEMRKMKSALVVNESDINKTYYGEERNGRSRYESFNKSQREGSSQRNTFNKSRREGSSQRNSRERSYSSSQTSSKERPYKSPYRGDSNGHWNKYGNKSKSRSRSHSKGRKSSAGKTPMKSGLRTSENKTPDKITKSYFGSTPKKFDLDKVDDVHKIFMEGIENETINKGIVDSGAPKAVMGEKWFTLYKSNLRENGCNVRFKSKKKHENFQFGTTDVFHSSEAFTIPVKIGKHTKEIEVALVDTNIPLLISKSDIVSWGAIIDYGNSTLRLRDNDEEVKLEELDSGHFVLPLSDPIDNIYIFIGKTVHDKRENYKNIKKYIEFLDMQKKDN